MAVAGYQREGDIITHRQLSSASSLLHLSRFCNTLHPTLPSLAPSLELACLLHMITCPAAALKPRASLLWLLTALLLISAGPMAFRRALKKTAIIGGGVATVFGLSHLIEYRKTQQHLTWKLKARLAHVAAEAELKVPFADELPSRQAQLAALRTEEFDVLIVGGGATGAGCALDAVTRSKIAGDSSHPLSQHTTLLGCDRLRKETPQSL
ncbi:hypothetical protein INR49_001290 [Caranx melampygus]|nr:hypothetical protein INR49_001290 [Caranx melampygus]